jgi:hypothetical protein
MSEMFKKIKLILFLLIILAGGAFFVFLKMQPNSRTVKKNESLPTAAVNTVQNGANDIKNEISGNNKTTNAAGLPNKISINVPFTSQAPFGVWDQYHEEACEEASLIMMKYYLDGKSLTPAVAEQEIQSMIAFEIKTYGDYKDTSAEQNVRIFADFYGLPDNGKNLKVVYDFSQEDLKKYLSFGNPIIIPAAGQLLGNPNYTAPGPPYHNLVLTGYDGNTIITNDPGTRKGQGYKYDIKSLYNAIHDFPGNINNINQGRKAMIVVE